MSSHLIVSSFTFPKLSHFHSYTGLIVVFLKLSTNIAMPRKPILLFLALILSFPLILHSQVEVLEVGIFGVSEDDRSRDLISSSDGNFVMVSYHVNQQFGVSSAIRKVTREMDILWEVELGQLERTFLRSLIETDDGGVLAIGTTEEDIWGDTESLDVLVVKLDADGNILWTRTHGGEFTDHGRYVQPMTDGGYIFISDTNSYDENGLPRDEREDFNIWISRVDDQGNTIWDQYYDNGSFEFSLQILPVANGSFLLCGYTYVEEDTTPHPGTDALILQFSSEGDIEWETTIGGEDTDLIRRIVQDSLGDIYGIGYSRAVGVDITENKGEADWLVAKLDNSGQLIWTKTLGSTGNEFAEDLWLTEEGNILVLGDTEFADGDFTENQGGFDIGLALLDNNGEVQWVKSIGGDDDDQPLRLEMVDGRNFIYGYSASTSGDITTDIGKDDLFLMELQIEKSILSQDQLELSAEEYKNGNVELNWQNQFHQEYQETYLQRSCDISQWTDILQLAYDSRINYFKDEDPCNGMNYYRLKVKSLNGNESYSNVEAIMVRTKEVLISPAIINQGEELFIDYSGQEKLELLLYSQTGNLLETKAFSGNDSISTSNYASGIYQVLILDRHGLISSHKIVIN